MSISIGEPIAGGQATRGWDELSIRFDEGMDLGKIRALLQQAKERGGSAGETVSAFNLVAIYFSPAAYERAHAALEAAGRLHPSRLVVLIADPRAEREYEQVLDRMEIQAVRDLADRLDLAAGFGPAPL